MFRFDSNLFLRECNSQIYDELGDPVVRSVLDVVLPHGRTGLEQDAASKTNSTVFF